MNLHKAAYDMAYSHIRRLARIKDLLVRAEREVQWESEDRSETLDMMDWLQDVGLKEIQKTFTFQNQFQAALLSAQARPKYPWKYEQPFWLRHNLYSVGYFNTGRGEPQFKYVKESPYPQHQDIPF
jgi:hypothetical protein